MNQRHIPPGTRAAMVRAVLAETYPKHALGAIAARFGVVYADLRHVIDGAGYPNTGQMAKAVELLEQEERRQAALEREAADAAAAAGDTVQDQLATTPPPAGEPDDDVTATPDVHEGRLTVVRVEDLEADPGNLRPPVNPNDEDLVDLADSIAENGLLQPIVARRDGLHLVVVMGRRRLAAVRRLKWTTVEAIVRGPMTEDEVLAAMLIENGQRKDLDPISEARGLKRLQVVLDCTEAELGRRIGRSRVFIRSRILLLSLSAEEQDRIRRGELTIGAAGHKAAIDSGRTGPKGVDRNWHLGPTHDLGDKVRVRCRRLGHSAARKVGGLGCGECWEVVIRTDERAHLLEAGHRRGECIVCEHPLSLTTSTTAATA